LRQSGEHGLDGWFTHAQYWLERVPERHARNEVGYCHGRGIARQFG